MTTRPSAGPIDPAPQTAYYHAGPRQYHESFGLDFEQLAVGQRFVHRPGLTLSQQDNMEEAMLSCNGAMLHYDARYAAQTSWDRPLMVSTLTLQKVLGMTTRSLGRRRRILDMASIRLSAPLFGGDTLYAETEVLGLAPGDAQTGVATLRTLGLKPDGSVVATLDYRVALWRAGAGPGAARRASPAVEPRFASHAAREDGALVEQAGLYFDDLCEGESFQHWPSRRILPEESRRQALLSFDWGEGSDDEDAVPPVPQSWVVGLVVALTTRTFGRVSANLGWTDVHFGQPLMPGDTLRARSSILSLRPSAKRPAEGVVGVRTEALNQRDEVVATFERALLVYRRGEGAPYAQAGY